MRIWVLGAILLLHHLEGVCRWSQPAEKPDDFDEAKWLAQATGMSQEEAEKVVDNPDYYMDVALPTDVADGALPLGSAPLLALEGGTSPLALPAAEGMPQWQDLFNVREEER